jgi:Myb-like DNA-binding protein REB1
MEDVIFPKIDKNKDNAFWSEISQHKLPTFNAIQRLMTSPAAAVPQRPIIAVYHHVRRSYHPLKQQGKWTAAENATLKQ